MATDDNRQAAEFGNKLNTGVTAAIDAKKRYDAAHARVLAATALLEEKEHVTIVFVNEGHAMTVLIEPPSPTSPPGPARGTALSNDDYEAKVIANVHIRAADV
jgi:hypothetical protein